MTYEETQIMNDFASRLFNLADKLDGLTPQGIPRWNKAKDNIWADLDDLGADMMNGLKWDEDWMTERQVNRLLT